MQSSPSVKEQFLIKTSAHDSGEQPSLLGPRLSVVTPSKAIFSLNACEIECERNNNLTVMEELTEKIT